MKRADTFSVRRLFSGNARFHTAPGKRSYSWTQPEIAQLLVDIEDGARTPRTKGAPAERLYLGMVIVSPARSGPRQLLDGQQRLVALSMFLAFARDRIPYASERARLDRLLFHKSFGRPLAPRLRLDHDAQTWFEDHILAERSTRQLPQGAPAGGPRNLLASARFMATAFDNYTPADLRLYTNFLLDASAVVLADMEDRTFAWRRGDPRMEPAQIRVQAE